MPPACFMIMPYDKKPTGAPADSKAPAKVDFDRLWETALRPAIEKAGYEAVRANEDIGALIIEEMMERLAISDLVIADVSIPNGNVYYEVGIRHVAQRTGCLLCSADWAKPLFDIAQMRHIRYPLPDESVSEATADEIIGVLSDAIQKMANGPSPFYQIFKDLPAYKYPIAKTTAFRKTVEELSAFQAEIMAARSAEGDDRRARALALRDRYGVRKPVQAAIALELLRTLRDCTDWKTTLDFIATLPDDLKESSFVKEQRALALSETGDHDTAIGALRELIATSGDTSERRGLLGGRYRRRWKQTGNAVDLDRAITEYDAGMKLDLNDYYSSSNLPRLYRTRKRRGDEEKAVIAASVAVTACERSRLRNSNDEWLNPTLLGAAFDAGDVEKAQELADLVAQEGPAAWKLDSTLATGRIAAQLYEDPKRAELLAVIQSLQALEEKEKGSPQAS